MELGGLQVITWGFVGLVAGWVAGQVMRDARQGPAGDLVVGLVGALMAGFLGVRLLPRSLGPLGSLVFAAFGAAVLVAILRAVSGSRRLA